MTMNFGPLNQAGGERRLNVAVTRARDKVVLVSSIRAADIDLAATQAPGVLMFHRYLDYAEQGKAALELESIRGGEFESPLERDVAQAIREMGYDVVPQVGCSGFCIDLGVVDPAQPGHFLLGVECDGASYHSSYVARDKDRLRQEVLEQLGWRIHRIWSPDWVNRRDREVERLRATIEDARRAGPPKPGSAGNSDNASSGSPNVDPPIVKPVSGSGANDSPNEAPWVRFYEVSRLTASSKSDPNFRDPKNRAEQVQLVEKVVETEGPVHVMLVARRLAEAWGLERVGNRMQEAVDEAIRRAVRGGGVKQQGDFLWRPTSSKLRLAVRVPRPGHPETLRPVSRISPSEIALAMRHLVEAGGGIRPEALVVEIARLFGFDRTGHRVRHHLDRVLKHLTRKGMLVQEGEFLHIGEDAPWSSLTGPAYR